MEGCRERILFLLGVHKNACSLVVPGEAASITITSFFVLTTHTNAHPSTATKMTSPRTNLGPLTTSFTYPASCTVVVQACENCGFGWQAQTCSDNILNDQGVQDNANCWPDRTNSSVYTEAALYGWGFYSPGISCPAGYATGCVATGSAKGGFPFQFSVLEHETVVGCCPT